jgi:hypothetical protein
MGYGRSGDEVKDHDLAGFSTHGEKQYRVSLLVKKKASSSQG